MKWPESIMDTPQGRRKAVSPLVISASRATDIPAFHAAWFMNRLRAGWCVWQNPFNAAQQQWISFEKCRVFVFWSKHPAPLLPYLPEIAARGHEFYVQYTLNDYEGTGLEPHLPPLAARVETFRRLSGLVGKKRVIWRFDPIILGGGLSVENTLLRLRRLAEALSPFTETLVFSFVDWYRKTARTLGRLNPDFRPPTLAEMQQIARGMAEMNRALARPLTLAACAEPLDMRGLGIARSRCVDPALLHRLWPDCETFARWCGRERENVQLPLFSAPPDGAKSARTDDGRGAACATTGSLHRSDVATGNGEKAESASNAATDPCRTTGTNGEIAGTTNGDPRGGTAARGATTAETRGSTDKDARIPPRGVRDSGQRPACGCAPSKDIGSYNTCRHFCAYCYANSSKQAVERRLSTMSEEDEAL